MGTFGVLPAAALILLIETVKTFVGFRPFLRTQLASFFRCLTANRSLTGHVISKTPVLT